jgi:hypothetical protein
MFKRLLELLKMNKPRQPILQQCSVSGSTISELDKIPVTEWAKIWCKLNSWEIPDCLQHIKPSWWDDEPSKKKGEMMMNFLRPIMSKIKYTIGDKACNREWNRDKMTDEEHEIFWNKDTVNGHFR